MKDKDTANVTSPLPRREGAGESPKWGKSWAAWPVNNYRITIVITALLLAFGLYGMYMMPKDEFPAYTVRQGLVVAVMPGATSEEIEAQVRWSATSSLTRR